MARSRAAVDSDRAQVVVTDDRGRGRDQLNVGDCAQRDQIALRGADADPKDVLDGLAVVSVGLDLVLPASAKAVEVVDVAAVPRGLQSAEEITHGDTQDLGALAV